MRQNLFFHLIGIVVLLAAQYAHPQPPPDSRPVIASSSKKPSQPIETKINPKDGAVMVFVPKGPFLRGTSPADTARVKDLRDKEGQPFSEGSVKDEKPQSLIFLDDFWIYQTEVTVKQYRAFCEATERAMPPSPDDGWIDDHPIVNVTWNDAVAYCAWAGASMPTEAQWEKAARGTEGQMYPWGNDWPPPRGAGNFSDATAVRQKPKVNVIPGVDDGYAQTSPVGIFPAGASPYGCFDMAGNVWEWCADAYDADFYQHAVPRNPINLIGDKRVVRGSAYDCSDTYHFRVADRGVNVPEKRAPVYGFRCVVAP